MKKLIFLIVMMTSVIGLTACGSSSNNTETKKVDADVTPLETTTSSAGDKVEVETNIPSDKAEVKSYLDEVKTSYIKLSDLGARWDELREASTTGEIDDYELGVLIQEEVLPANMALLEELEAIRTPNDETTEVNEILIEAIGNQQLAFTEILSAIETGDSSKITSANALLNDVRKNDREFGRKIEQLLSDYNLEF
ncbi:hypothetical protein CSV80_00655 [Sporosarcina sp. P12(2017)]|uniref:hypothetical protein n=1 Tax=unclassified Sporosarcina TaxID=2647733 RepID=UPI000C165063|nr:MULTISPECIES: hypothetical protein [unclassified Sporosarcina]PIC59066.1 hypothetical protein CSV81_00655 [Sporosarcina sp. P10]PIC62387.1 hypothetical protein CSV80_00655 [Sporosarcina sp. P12(2017)]